MMLYYLCLSLWIIMKGFTKGFLTKSASALRSTLVDFRKTADVYSHRSDQTTKAAQVKVITDMANEVASTSSNQKHVEMGSGVHCHSFNMPHTCLLRSI